MVVNMIEVGMKPSDIAERERELESPYTSGCRKICIIWSRHVQEL